MLKHFPERRGRVLVVDDQPINIRMLRHDDSPVANHVTISVGVAVLRPRPDGDRATLLGLADQALYRAKNEGRDRCRLAQ